MSTTFNNTSTLEEVAARRAAGAKLVFTNGCFDILHVGHARYLAEARSLGDMLLVGLNSDSSVRELKGEGRPVVPETERREMLLALESVDYVCLFSEETPLELIKQAEPDVLVKGGDWPVETIVGSTEVIARGGKVLSLPFHQGHSTSSILARLCKP